MISKKICLIGAFAVGKTSLVKQFVESIFEEKYHTTIGVKIDKKSITLNDELVQLLIWDIEGVDVFTELKQSYLRGASGIALVVDGTRPQSLNEALKILKQLPATLQDVEVVLMVNKTDLTEKWQLADADIDQFKLPNQNVFYTSAKSGKNVDNAFLQLAKNLTVKSKL
ncbi:Rab family GTPase [Aliikangiella sp. IMCC44653]